MPLINTEYFSEAAKYKTKHGVYCQAPYGSVDYNAFWDEEDHRCLNGYSVGGTRITGYHYWFLNFKQLEIVIDPRAKASRKKMSFPRFWYQHYDFFHALERAERAGQHFIILKPRGTGFSEIMSSIATCDYTLVRDSKNFFFASNQGYLNKDGILTKCWDQLEFLNAETERAYRHLRQKKDQDMHKRASYIDSKGGEKGYGSEIIGRVIDHPRKVRGARTGAKGHVFFEEGGSFPNLKEAIITTRPLVEQGGVATGQIIVWGTGGEQGPGIAGLEEMFYKPEAFNMYAYENEWDEDRVGTTCGYFFPTYTAMDAYMDKHGNPLVESAKKHHIDERNKIRQKDPEGEDKYIAEYPFTPAEALIRLSHNIFPVAELQRQLTRVQTDKGIQGMLKHGSMAVDENGIPYFQLGKGDTRPITDFPHDNTTNLKGCMTMVEVPFRDQNGFTPPDMYTIVVDPYYKDESADTTSLASAYVYKHINNISNTEDDIIVAWYNTRPDSLDTFYRQLFLMARFYNATIQSEIAGGGKGILDYAKIKKQLHRCEKEPDILSNKENATKDINKSYFMNMAGDRPQLAHTYLADWLKQERSILAEREDMPTILNLHKIYDEGLLKELIKFNAEGNFDRVSAMRLLPFMVKERADKEYAIASEKQKDSFYNREFHTGDIGHYDDSFRLDPWELYRAEMNAEARPTEA